MAHKNDYSVVAFLSTGEVKKWSFVHSLAKFGSFLDSKHPGWMYMNVYERRSRKYLKRFYKGSPLPSFL